MPIYKNNSANIYNLLDFNDKMQIVNPGEIISTDQIYVMDDLDEILSSSFYNPVVKMTDITLPYVSEFILHELTQSFIIVHITDSVDISMGIIGNHVLKNWVSTDPVIIIDIADDKTKPVSGLFFDGTATGTFTIIEFRHN